MTTTRSKIYAFLCIILDVFLGSMLIILLEKDNNNSSLNCTLIREESDGFSYICDDLHYLSKYKGCSPVGCEAVMYENCGDDISPRNSKCADNILYGIVCVSFFIFFFPILFVIWSHRDDKIYIRERERILEVPRSPTTISDPPPIYADCVSITSFPTPYSILSDISSDSATELSISPPPEYSERESMQSESVC